MTIQFLCPDCSQPIEVDDELAGRIVACYYCKNAVQAPEANELETEFIPVASAPSSPPVADPYGRDPLPDPSQYQFRQRHMSHLQAQQSSTNLLGCWH